MIKWYTKEVENPSTFNSINIGDVLNELKLQLSLRLMPFVDEVFLVDHVRKAVVFGRDGAGPQLAHEGKQKKVK